MMDIQTLLQMDNMAVDAEMATEKVRVMLEDVFNYLEDTPEDFLKFYKEQNLCKISIAMDFIRKIEQEVLSIQKITGEKLEEIKRQESKCA